jgi:hypothetical protein
MPSDNRTRGARVFVLLAGSLILPGILGCGQIAPKTYPVQGKVEFPGGDLRKLAGAHIQVTVASDRRIAATGEIREDGTFSLETIHDGKPVSGAREGEYQVRLVLSDEDKVCKSRNGLRLATRYTQYTESGLSIKVPTTGDVQLTVLAQ